MRSDAGRPLTIAEDVVGWNIAAATRDAGRVFGERQRVIGVGDERVAEIVR